MVNRLFYGARPVVDPGVECFSDLLVFQQKHKILLQFEEMRVTEPSRFDGAFAKGDRVVELHFNPSTKPDSLTTLRIMADLFRRYERMGFAGFFGDTPNTRLADIFGSYGARRIPTPADKAAIVRKNYACSAKEKGFPQRYKDAPVERVILRFDDATEKVRKVRPPKDEGALEMMYYRRINKGEAKLLPTRGRSTIG